MYCAVTGELQKSDKTIGEKQYYTMYGDNNSICINNSCSAATKGDLHINSVFLCVKKTQVKSLRKKEMLVLQF